MDLCKTHIDCHFLALNLLNVFVVPEKMKLIRLEHGPSHLNSVCLSSSSLASCTPRVLASGLGFRCCLPCSQSKRGSLGPLCLLMFLVLKHLCLCGWFPLVFGDQLKHQLLEISSPPRFVRCHFLGPLFCTSLGLFLTWLFPSSLCPSLNFPGSLCVPVHFVFI